MANTPRHDLTNYDKDSNSYLMIPEIGNVFIGGMGNGLRLIEKWISDGESHYSCFCEANLLSNRLKLKVKRAITGSGVIFPDGIVLLQLAKIYSEINIERVTGPAFFEEACKYGIEREWRHFFYGGGPGVAAALAQRMKKKYPQIRIVGTYSPPFRNLTEKEENEVANSIARVKPDLLWVALGSPKQEIWTASFHRRKLVPVILPVGAAFDFHVGARTWAPKIFRKLGVEWLFRFFTGGKRIFVRNFRCVPRAFSFLLGEYLKVRVFGKSSSNEAKQQIAR